MLQPGMFQCDQNVENESKIWFLTALRWEIRALCVPLVCNLSGNNIDKDNFIFIPYSSKYVKTQGNKTKASKTSGKY